MPYAWGKNTSTCIIVKLENFKEKRLSKWTHLKSTDFCIDSWRLMSIHRIQNIMEYYLDINELKENMCISRSLNSAKLSIKNKVKIRIFFKKDKNTRRIQIKIWQCLFLSIVSVTILCFYISIYNNTQAVQALHNSAEP